MRTTVYCLDDGCRWRYEADEGRALFAAARHSKATGHATVDGVKA